MGAMADYRELICRRCWWREGRACYNDKMLRAGGVNKIPRTVEGDDRNGMEITEGLWEACLHIPKLHTNGAENETANSRTTENSTNRG